jgi:putative endonuclease
LAFYVYIVASARNGTIYLGMTDDLARRVWEHKEKIDSGFTATYGCDNLVWCETHDIREIAFARERQLEQWRHSWKLMPIKVKDRDQAATP